MQNRLHSLVLAGLLAGAGFAAMAQTPPAGAPDGAGRPMMGAGGPMGGQRGMQGRIGGFGQAGVRQRPFQPRR